MWSTSFHLNDLALLVRACLHTGFPWPGLRAPCTDLLRVLLGVQETAGSVVIHYFPMCTSSWLAANRMTSLIRHQKIQGGGIYNDSQFSRVATGAD